MFHNPHESLHTRKNSIQSQQNKNITNQIKVVFLSTTPKKCTLHLPPYHCAEPTMTRFNDKRTIYTERNFQTATQYLLIYLNKYDTYIATIYTQYGKIN